MKDLLRICDLSASGLHQAFVALDEAKEVSRHWGDALRGDGVVVYFSNRRMAADAATKIQSPIGAVRFEEHFALALASLDSQR